MPSLLQINPSVIGPRDPLILTLADGSLDFLQASTALQFFFKFPNTAQTGALYLRILFYTVIDAATVELRVDDVGPNMAQQVPVGRYEVIARAGFWEGIGDRLVEVRATPQSTPPLTTGQSIQVMFVSLQTRARLWFATLPSQLNTVRSRFFLLFNTMLHAIRLGPSLIPPGQQVPGGPGGPAGGGGQGPWLQPMVDGEVVFPAVANLVEQSERFCFIATWGFDEDVRLGGTGQNDPATPDAESLLKRHAVELARIAERRVSPRTIRRVHGNVRVLVWDATLDLDWTGGGNDLGDMTVVWIDWRDVRGMRGSQAADYLRTQGLSGEARWLLAEVHSTYRRLRNPPGRLPYPSGVMAAIQAHPTKYFLGSHHQKFVVTEHGSYVGGLNFYRDYWDRPVHDQNDAKRGTSKSWGSAGSGGGPLHDTGCILADHDVQDRLRRMFAVRWDAAVGGPGAFEGFVRALRRVRSQTGRRDERLYRELIRAVRRVKRKMIGLGVMRIPLDPQPIPNAETNHVAIGFTLPRDVSGGAAGGWTEILRAYERMLDSVGGPETLVFIETQYFDHRGLAVKLLQRYLDEGGAREAPFAHIVIPYKPDTHWADRWLNPFTEWKRIVRDEFRHLRWCEIRSMDTILEDNNGRWEPTHRVPAPDRLHIESGAHDDPSRLTPDTKVVFTDIEDMAGNPVPNFRRKVKDFMTKGGIVTYTLALDDAGDPSGSDANDRQRSYLLDNGIYVHSKAAIFLNNDDRDRTVATVGSANLTARSLDDGGDQDSESNVFWRHHDRIQEFFDNLVSEHTGGPTDSFSIQEAGLVSLNHVRTGSGPGRHLVRLDLADRFEHLV
ncbi:MAG: hypothetical protein IH872_13020 [Chloroflexi bacterium]|nr:hypothetical protein [Chloroflexota bacterium]